MLISLVGVTSAEQKTADTDLSRDRGENVPTERIAAFTYPGHPPAKNGDVIGLESFVHGIPDEAGPYHSGTRCCVVGHLVEPPGVD